MSFERETVIKLLGEDFKKVLDKFDPTPGGEMDKCIATAHSYITVETHIESIRKKTERIREYAGDFSPFMNVGEIHSRLDEIKSIIKGIEDNVYDAASRACKESIPKPIKG